MSATSRNSLMRAKLAQHMLKSAQGFTLIELLVVIVIVGILSATAIPTFLNQIRRARTAEAQAALTDVTRGSEAYRLDEGVYPPTFLDIESEDAATPGANGTLYMQDPFTTKAPNYDVPDDPTRSPDGSSGVLWQTEANANAYKNGDGDFLLCRVGLGTGADRVALPPATGGNLDAGCNLKIADTGIGTPADL